MVNKSSSTIWFSGTNSHEGRLGVLLCEREKPELGPCVWVRGIGHVIEIQSCASGAVPESGAIDLSKCTVESRIDGVRKWNEYSFSVLRLFGSNYNCDTESSTTLR